jgi:hypothetical protein
MYIMKFKHYSYIKRYGVLLFCGYFLIPTLSYPKKPLEGNKGVEDVVVLISDMENRDDLKKDIHTLSKKDDCRGISEGSTDIDDQISKSNDSSRYFFDLQFLTLSENGDPTFNSLPVAKINLSEFITNYSTFSGLDRKDVLNLSDTDLRKLLTMYSGLPGISADALSDAVESSLLVKKMVTFNTSDAALSFIGSELGEASFSKKVSFIATYLNFLKENYEDDMLNGGPTSGQDRLDDDLHLAMKTAIEDGINIPTGVCRHMHQMAIRLARKLGVDEAFGVSFRTAAGGHRSLVLTDPNDPTKVVQLNYGNKSVTAGLSGPEALSQNGLIPDTGINFKIHNGEDQLVLSLPSELGGLLNKVSGGSDQDLALTYNDKSQIQQAGINTPYGTVRLFHGGNPLGNQAQTSGIAYNERVTFNEVFYGNYGVAGFSSHRPTQQGELSNNGLYFRASHGADIEVFKGDNLTVNVIAKQHNRASIFNAEIEKAPSTNENISGLNASYNIDAQLGLSMEFSTQLFRARTQVMSQILFDQLSSSNGKRLGIVGSTYNIDQDFMFSTGSSIDLSSNFGAAIYDLGTGVYGTYHSRIGLDSRSSSTSLNIKVEGRLTDDTPFWLPEAEHAGRVQVFQGINNNMFYIGLEGKQSFDFSKYHYLGLNLGGKFGGN